MYNESNEIFFELVKLALILIAYTTRVCQCLCCCMFSVYKSIATLPKSFRATNFSNTKIVKLRILIQIQLIILRSTLKVLYTILTIILSNNLNGNYLIDRWTYSFELFSTSVENSKAINKNGFMSIHDNCRQQSLNLNWK